MQQWLRINLFFTRMVYESILVIRNNFYKNPAPKYDSVVKTPRERGSSKGSTMWERAAKTRTVYNVALRFSLRQTNRGVQHGLQFEPLSTQMALSPSLCHGSLFKSSIACFFHYSRRSGGFLNNRWKISCNYYNNYCQYVNKQQAAQTKQKTG